ncbi:MAG: hypothetical protein RLZZ330_260 [Actinomycetota bacterium]|jgi:hypothetical protein
MIKEYSSRLTSVIKQLFNESLMLFIVIAVVLASAGLFLWRNPKVGSVEFAQPKLVNDSICIGWQNQFSSSRSTLYSVNGALHSDVDATNIDVEGQAIALAEGFYRTFPVNPGSSSRVVADGKDSPLISNYVFATELPKNMPGFAADVCRAPQSEWWFNGISTLAGYGATLVMVNPDNTDTVVSIQAFSLDGSYQLGENRRVVIGGDATRVLDLTEIMPGVKSASLLIKSVDGRIVANVQSEVIKGLKSRGRSFVGPVYKPAKEIVINRIPINATSPKLHLLAVEEDTYVTVTAHTASGSFVVEGLNGVFLDKNKQRMIDLTRAQGGEALSLTISADKPVLASASYFAKNRGLGDYEVVPGVIAIKQHTTFVVPISASKTTLVLGSIQGSNLQVTLRSKGVVKWVQNVEVGQTQFLSQAIANPIPAGSVITIESQDNEFYASAIFTRKASNGDNSSMLTLIDPESQVSRGVRLTLAIS